MREAGMRLDVYLDFDPDPDPVPIGTLERRDTGALSFQYRPGFVERTTEQPPSLSLSLPIRAVAYGDRATRGFFENLLPEGERREQIRARHRLDADDVVGILAHLGRDCAGAISVVPEGEKPTKVPGDLTADYTAIDSKRLEEDVLALSRRRPPRSAIRFSLAGVQSKMAVTIDPVDPGRLLEPATSRGVPSTHILKVEAGDLPSLVFNEYVCMETARRLGFDVAEVELRRIANRPVLLVRRFDREIRGRRVYRLHQEDGCQILGLPPRAKYQSGPADRLADGVFEDDWERFDQPSFPAFGAAAAWTARPVVMRDLLIRWAFLNFLLGNEDAHAKNFAFLHRGPRPEPAPLYDLVCTARYEDFADADFAIWIGSASRPSELTGRALYEMLQDLALRPSAQTRIIERTLKRIAEGVLPAFDAVVDASRGSDGIGPPVSVLPVRDVICNRLELTNHALGWAIPFTSGPLGLPPPPQATR